MEAKQLITALVELLSSSAQEPSPYYTQDDSPLGRDRHLKHIRTGKLRGFKDGRTVYARREDVHRFIESNPVVPKTKDEEKPKSESRSVVDMLSGL